ncbi:succinate dehydrogenase/fumarate reductase iron-sulfur subunit [Methanolobus sp. ZRKC3]|uniref:succinate dehydrogenase/fumarate reductase iron-sulfur subunit n=1 Tax=Methanolobus sp. ZRKC3 TaxID=3125786 RepID=UPI0032558031
MVELNIRRQDGDRIWSENFTVEDRPGMTVLEALFHVQERIDGSLCFRYSCRGAVCGSCAMLINKVPRLACRTQVSEVKDESTDEPKDGVASVKPSGKVEGRNEILVEPLPNLNVIRDLIVDMDHFYELVDSIKPWINKDEGEPEKETLMEPAMQVQLEKYTNCILCATCHGACPAASRNGEYLGPAALAKAWRFYLDPRSKEEDRNELLKYLNSDSGVWGCDVVYKCVAVCPKKVTPTQGILDLRGKME